MKPTLYFCILISILAGCGEPSQPPEPKTKLFQPQREALDKSKEVQQTVNEQVEQQNQAIKQQSELSDLR